MVKEDGSYHSNLHAKCFIHVVIYMYTHCICKLYIVFMI